MPTLMALILASACPVLIHRLMPGSTPIFIKLVIDLFLWFFVFIIVYRILSRLRPEIDK